MLKSKKEKKEITERNQIASKQMGSETMLMDCKTLYSLDASSPQFGL